MNEQLALPFSQGAPGYVGSRVKCVVDVEDFRRRLLRDVPCGFLMRGPWPRFGDIGTVTDIRPFSIFDRGVRYDEVPRVVVRFDQDGQQRYMAPSMLEVMA